MLKKNKQIGHGQKFEKVITYIKIFIENKANKRSNFLQTSSFPLFRKKSIYTHYIIYTQGVCL